MASVHSLKAGKLGLFYFGPWSWNDLQAKRNPIKPFVLYLLHEFLREKLPEMFYILFILFYSHVIHRYNKHLS